MLHFLILVAVAVVAVYFANRFAESAVEYGYAKSVGSRAGSMRQLLNTYCPSLVDKRLARMVPTPFLYTCMMQSLYSHSLFSNIKYNRELFVLSDGGTVSLDWYPGPDSFGGRSTPIVVAMTGIAGGSKEYHVRCVAKRVACDRATPCRFVCMNFRGCARTLLTNRRQNDAVNTSDYREVVNSICERFPEAPVFGVGFSLGASLLTKYLGEEGDTCKLTAAIAISCPFDLTVVRRMFNAKTYSQYLPFERNKDVILSGDQGFDADTIRNCQSMADVERIFILKDAGFKTSDEYYNAACSANYIDRIGVPYLSINSLDDQITPVQGIPFDKFKANPNTVLALTEHGGHLGFLTGWQPRIWYLDTVAEFVALGAVAGRKSGVL
ncbi:AB-hydrolase YheT [Linderina pennispora]|uniref:AB-hydrolase YheT n=1 Tax=Linderina pennispora TaxID=61395 RepID=A0A1Y1WE97_9FUNG|nr:AB-hydrolase YheT [Linderina pennispora]ORX71849.1 AB-hydrolase YheT [Linderina pennispora]